MATSTSKVSSKSPPENIVKAVPVSATNAQIIGTNSVQCVLGKEKFLRPIFSYYRMPESWQADGDKTLREGIEHAFTFTMLRDQFYGGWAHCWKNAADGLYHLKLTSPRASDDVRGYAELIPAFVRILAQAQKLVATALKKAPAEQQTALSFPPPFGLSMLNARGVMLLHYPPDEPIVYLNYLHARTIKRWDSLLICNDYQGAQNPLLEAIVVFIDASREHVDGRNQCHPGELHLNRIVATQNARENVDKYACVADFDEIKENNFNLNIPR